MTTLDLFPPPEVQARDAVLDAFEERRPDYLAAVREGVRRIALARYDRTATADEARQIFEALDPPADVSRNVLGAVWRTGDWVKVGEIVSEIEGSHGNRTGQYRLVER